MSKYWNPERLRDAAKLLEDASRHLGTSYPYSVDCPNPHTLPAVKAMIAAAITCIEESQPKPVSE